MIPQALGGDVVYLSARSSAHTTGLHVPVDAGVATAFLRRGDTRGAPAPRVRVVS
jgi:hypothetical protein